jgi:DNA repair protein RadC
MNNQAKPHYLGHRQRLKEKYIATGLNGWLDHEILEFILSYSIARKDTKSIAKELLCRFKSFSGVIDSDIEGLQGVKGVSTHSAILLKLFKDISFYYIKNDAKGKNIISSPGIAVNYLTALLKGSKDEEFFALYLDSANRLIAGEILQTGTVNKSAVYPRKVAERALLHKAAGVIISHNHPGGSLKASEDDKRSTSAIKDSLSAIEIELLDHIIICGTEYFSFKENHLL